MINLKEACRYANFLDSIIYSVNCLFDSRNNMYKVTESHLKSKSNPEATDEIIENEQERVFSCQLHDMVFLAEELSNEKLKLSLAISKAKKENLVGWKENDVELDLDSAVEYNKRIRSLCSYLKGLENRKDSVEKLHGRDYKINNEGNQVAYNYTIEKNLVVDYDKKIVGTKSRKLLEKADKISTLIDEFMLSKIVDFTPKYNIHDSVQDIINQFELELK